MRSLKKAIISNTSLIKFLRSYRSTPHASTQKSSKDMLMRTMSSTNRMPVLLQDYDHDPVVVVEDARAKENMKKHANRRHVRVLEDVRVGDLVLVKTEPVTSKYDPLYDPEPYRVEEVNGN